MKIYMYLVENKKNKNRYVMIGNLKDCNIGSGRYLYDFTSSDYEYAKETPYGLRNNITNGLKYDSRRYKVIHQTVA